MVENFCDGTSKSMDIEYSTDSDNDDNHAVDVYSNSQLCCKTSVVPQH